MAARSSDYLDDMVTRRRDALTDDLLSDMIRAEVDGDRLAHDELLMLAATLLMAGTDTTRNQLAAAVQIFCEHPDQWALLAEHPELAPKAVEEAMRYSPVIFTTMRIAVEDVELGRRHHPGGHARHRQYRCGQPRPGGLPRPRSLRHHPRGRPRHADLRWRHPLLPGCAPRENRTRRGPDDNGAPNAQHPRRRPRPVEVDNGHHRSSEPAGRVHNSRLEPVAPGPAVRVVDEPVCGLRP